MAFAAKELFQVVTEASSYMSEGEVAGPIPRPTIHRSSCLMESKQILSWAVALATAGVSGCRCRGLNS